RVLRIGQARIGDDSVVEYAALVCLARDGQVDAKARAERLMVLHVRRSQTEGPQRLPPGGPPEGERRADAIDALVESVQRVGHHRYVVEALDRLALRPNSGADVGAEKRCCHKTVSAQRIAERGVPFSGARHQPVAGAQIEGVAEMIT